MPARHRPDPPPRWLRLAGPARIGQGDGPGQALARKDAALLALLVLDGDCARERVLALLWPEAPRALAQASLRQRAYRLRRALGAEVIEVGETVRLAPGCLADVAADRDPADAEGDLLAGFDYGDAEALDAWVASRRAAWAVRRSAALDRRAGLHEQRGELAAALAACERLLALDPVNEAGWLRRMRLHWLHGDRAAAVAAFERYERLLKDECGLAPGPEALRLLQAIERAPPAAAAVAPLPPELLRPPHRVGRDGALHAMQAAWELGRAFVLLGEAGLGKTRLLQEIAAGRPGVQCGQALFGDEAVPHALAARLLGAALAGIEARLDAGVRAELTRFLPGYGAVATGPAHPALLRQAAEEALRCAMRWRGLEVLLLDDLHRADAASIELLLGWLANPRLPGLRIGIAMRPPAAGHPSERWLAAAAGSGGPVIVKPGPLDAPAVAELLATLPPPPDGRWPDASALARHTGGNPLFVLETLRAWLRSGAGPGHPLPRPATVDALIGERLAQLPADALALARLAALAGPDFDVALAAASLGASPLALADRWAALEAAQLLQGDRPAHDLVAQVLVDGMPPSLRCHLHAEVAGRLAGRPGVPAARIAGHWQQAGRGPEAARAWLQAADDAARAGRIAEQCRALEAAAAARHAAGDAAGAFDALALLHEPLLTVRGLDAARDVTARLQALAADPDRLLRARLWAARDRLLAHEDLDAVIAAMARLAAEAAHDPALAADARVLRGQALGVCRRPDDAVADLRTALALAEAAGDPARRLAALSAWSHALMWNERLVECRPVLEACIDAARQIGDRNELNVLEGNLAVVLAALGETRRARALAERVHRTHRQLETAQGLPALALASNLAALQVQAGEIRGARGLLRALRRAGAGEPAWIRAGVVLAEAALRRLLGDPARAAAMLSGLAAEADALPAKLQARRRVLGARIAADLGVAPADLDLAATPAPEASLSAQLADLCAHDPAAALERLPALVARAGAQGQPALMQAARLRAIECRVALGGSAAADRAAAADALRLLRRLPDGLPGDWSLADAWLACARLLAAAGRPHGAARAVARAQAWLARVRPQVPARAREAFATRHPAHRAILCWPDGRPHAVDAG